MTQDNQGFMWFATNSGLFRYDGYALRQYRHDDADPNTISSDDIRTLFKDRSGMLWIGTTARGLDRLDPAREVVTHYRHNNKDPNSLSSDNLICIRQDSSSVLWFGTSNGLNRLEPGKTSFTRFNHDANDPASLSANTILALHEDRQGNFGSVRSTGSTEWTGQRAGACAICTMPPIPTL
jgi:ligand-binding sensor domain-containing protein